MIYTSISTMDSSLLVFTTNGITLTFLYLIFRFCAHSFTRNWQLPFLNQRKGENDLGKYFMINLYENILTDPAGIKTATGVYVSRLTLKLPNTIIVVCFVICLWF